MPFRRIWIALLQHLFTAISLAPRDDVSECPSDDDDEFFPFNNGQKRIGGDGAKIMPAERWREGTEKKEIVIFCRIPLPIFSKLFSPLARFDG